MNKTIRDQMRKQKFLTQMMDRLKASDTFDRNSSASSNTRKATLLPPGVKDNVNTLTKLPEVSIDVSNLGRLLPEKGSTPILGLTPPDLVYPESQEKNVLIFKFKPKTVRSKTLVNRINLWLYVWTKENKDKSMTSQTVSSPSPTTRDLKDDGQRDQRKGKRIKIRVFLSNVNGSRGQRIAELQTRINGSTWGKLGLPVSLINNLTDTDSSSTVWLRIECKRCSGNTQLIMPGNKELKRCRQRHGMKKNKKTDDRMRRWRKHCARASNVDEKLYPFIVIEEKSKPSSARFKRSSVADIKSCPSSTPCNILPSPDGSPAFNTDLSTNVTTMTGHQVCQLVTTYVDFSDLNIDYIIVYPPGIEYATCVSGCRDTSSTPPPSSDLNLDEISDLISQKLQYHERRRSGRPLQTSQSYLNPRYSNPRHHNQQLKQQHPHQRHYSYQQRGRQHRWYIHKWSRLKKMEVCKPLQTENLDVVYLNSKNKLVQIQLTDMIVSQCGCK